MRLVALDSAVERLERALGTQTEAIHEVQARVVGMNQAFDLTRETMEKMQNADPASWKQAVEAMSVHTATMGDLMAQFDTLSTAVRKADERLSAQQKECQQTLCQLNAVHVVTEKLKVKCEQIEKDMKERERLWRAPSPHKGVKFISSSSPEQGACQAAQAPRTTLVEQS